MRSDHSAPEMAGRLERTHDWIEKARWLVMHHDRRVEVSEAWVWLAAGRQLLNRLTHTA